ncbi:FAD binding domain-containing protein [candidate division CSSED10-310 bacterium]|uniref:FAD binding domain-containing protein n=1 Tax=candidate division CSSED10-310 bacterium TaxID=2855610 RepID=A0ABV6YSY4_UNCC1
MISCDYFQPQSLPEVFQCKESYPDARYVGGGTDLLVKLRKGGLPPSALISLRSVSELSSVAIGETTRIGAMTTISELIRHPVLGHHYPVLIEAARNMACVQIRNVATIGGNLCNCSPCADMATPLLIYEARVRLRNSAGEREISLQEFFHGPGATSLAPAEILTGIVIPPPPPLARGIFMKKGRVKMDLAVASVSVLLALSGLECDRARLAAGSVAPVPLRLSPVESLLEGEKITPELLAEAQRVAADCVSPISDIRASEEYRRTIVGIYVKRAVAKIAGLAPD